jgi:radical SAM superfamily enzyme YgiQ (UPF0313 family)
MKKQAALVQPTFRKMDGRPVKGFTLGSCPLELPLLAGAMPEQWEKTSTHEYFDDINYDTDASVVFITSTTNDILHCRDVAIRFKERGKIVIFGGHEDVFSEDILKEVCDSFYRGIPGPADMQRMLDDAENGCLRASYTCGQALDFPYDYSVYEGRKIRFLHVQAGTGCLFKCEYCRHPWASNGGTPRFRDLDFVMEDLRSIRRITRYAAFKDPNFYNDRAHLLALCDRMEQEDLGIIWGAQMPIYVGGDPEALKALHAAGCRVIYIGFETLEAESLKEVRKPFDPEKYLPLVKRIQEEGIRVVGYFMVGFDHDTKDSFERIFDFVREAKLAYPLLNILVPIPGTPLFDRLKKEGRLDLPDVESFMKVKPLYSIPCNKAYYEPRNMTRAELEDGYMDLVKRLASYKEILRRVLHRPGRHTLTLLKLNLSFRMDYKRMAQDYAKRLAADRPEVLSATPILRTA